MSNKKFNAQQQKALKTLDKNVLLSAGAGSGKTEVLSSRFIQIMENDVNASNILAITFTIKAAAEMRVRIARNIQEVIETKGNLVDGNGWQILKSKHDTDYWNNQLIELQHAQISTIHSLCARILMENPIEAKLAPGSSVQEEEEGFTFDDDCLNGFIRDSITKEDADVMHLIKEYQLYYFTSVLKELVGHRNSILSFGGDRSQALNRLLEQYDVKPIEKINYLISLKEDFCTKVANNTYKAIGVDGERALTPSAKKKLDAIASVLQKLTSECNDKDLIGECVEKIQDLKGFGFESKKVKYTVQELDDLYKLLKSPVVLFQAYINRDKAKALIPHWYHTIEKFTEYREVKRNEANTLSFDDLEEKAIALLENNKTIREKYQKLFTYIMVDEFQDTNESQKHLIYLLYGNDKDKLQKPVNVPNKNLFVVGDPKQSIYRFRNADVRVFHQVRQDIENGDSNNLGVAIEMNTNYRSDANIIKACNYFFPKVMGTDKTEPVYYEPLEAGREDDGATVELISIERPENGTGSNGGVVSNDIRNAEGNAIAERILALRDDGHKYNEMTILLRSRTKMDNLKNALLEHNIPVVVSGGQGFYKRPEIQNLIAIVKACHSSYNVVELAVALKSPFFASGKSFIDESEITKLALKGNLWDSLQAYNGENEIIRNAQKVLSNLQQKMQLIGLSEFWRFMWNELDVEKNLLAMQDADAMLANARKLFDEAIAFSNNTNGTVGDWIQYIDKLISDERVQDNCADVIAEDAVTIMTIHGSKGLQFPLTFVPMLDSKGGGQPTNSIFSEALGLGIKVPNDKLKLEESLVYLVASEENEILENEERARLLYVAMTRASKMLFLSGVPSEKDEKDNENNAVIAAPTPEYRNKSWLNQFLLGGLENFASYSLLTASKFRSEIVDKLEQWISGIFAVSKGQEITEGGDQENKSRIQDNKLSDFDATGITVFTPSALQTYKRCPKQYYFLYVNGISGFNDILDRTLKDEDGNVIEKEPALHEYRGELEASLFGNLLHKALEVYANNGARPELAEQAFNESLSDNEINDGTNYGDAKQMFLNYISSPMYAPIAEAARNGRCLSELRFSFYINDTFRLSGIMDCVYYDANGNLHIVDFKTGHYHDKNDGYGMQLALYKLVASKLYGVTVSDATLHYLPDLKPWKLEDDSADYLEMAKDIAADVYSCNKNGAEFKPNLESCYNCQYSWLCNKE